MTSHNDRHVVFTEHLLYTSNGHGFWGHRSMCKSPDFPTGSEVESQCSPQAQLLALSPLFLSGFCSMSIASQEKQTKSQTHGAFGRPLDSNPPTALSRAYPPCGCL